MLKRNFVDIKLSLRKYIFIFRKDITSQEKIEWNFFSFNFEDKFPQICTNSSWIMIRNFDQEISISFFIVYVNSTYYFLFSQAKYQRLEDSPHGSHVTGTTIREIFKEDVARHNPPLERGNCSSEAISSIVDQSNLVVRQAISWHAEELSRCSIAEKVIAGNNDDGCHRRRPPPPPPPPLSSPSSSFSVVYSPAQERREGKGKGRKKASLEEQLIRTRNTYARTTAAMERTYARSPPSPSGIRNIRLPIAARAWI